MFKKTRAFKRFVKRNKFRALWSIATALGVVVVVQRRGLNLHDEYLKEKGLYDEYYTVEG